MIIFSKLKDKDDLKEVFVELYDDTNSNYNQSVIEAGINSLNNLDDRKTDKLIRLSNKIDTYYDEKNSNILEIPNKLNTMITSSILYDKYYDKIKNYTKDELIVLSYFLSAEELELFDNHINTYNKQVLELLCSRFNNYEDREHALEVVSDKIGNKELLDSEVYNYMNSIDKDRLNELYIEYASSLANHLSSRGIHI